MLTADKKPGTDASEQMAFAEVLKRLRKKRGLTQFQLAVEAGITLGTLAALEQGENTDPRLSTFLRLAHALGVTLDELAAESREGPAPKKQPKQKRGK
jgi:transcriptional regulator with XRE-family HTH domain